MEPCGTPKLQFPPYNTEEIISYDLNQLKACLEDLFGDLF